MTELALHFAIGFPLALLYCNAVEWFVHKYVLHGVGKKKGSFWNFHWYEHHGLSRRHGMLDPMYQRGLRGWNGQTKEALVLGLATAAHLPLMLLVPGFITGMVYSSVNYYFMHKKAHLDKNWARRRMPWHVDHHLGANQDANWCVTKPWFDWIMGTREKYVGTEREERDNERRTQLRERRATMV